MTAVVVHLDDALLQETQQAADARRVTVDEVIGEALAQATANSRKLSAAPARGEEGLIGMFKRLQHFKTGAPYTREEMNER